MTVTDLNGCSDSDEQTIFVEKPRLVYIPNVFSPNGDGINDLLMIYTEGSGVEEIQSFQIFDRWGEMVFEKEGFSPNDSTFGWDGSFMGEPLNQAVFVFLAKIKYIDGRLELLSRDVTLLR